LATKAANLYFQRKRKEEKGITGVKHAKKLWQCDNFFYMSPCSTIPSRFSTCSTFPLFYTKITTAFTNNPNTSYNMCAPKGGKKYHEVVIKAVAL